MVNMESLKYYAIGFGGVILSVAFVIIIISNMEGLHLGTAVHAGAGSADNTTTSADLLLANGTSLIGSLITTWGSIILLGVVVVAVFVGIFIALSYMSNNPDERK